MRHSCHKPSICKKCNICKTQKAQYACTCIRLLKHPCINSYYYLHFIRGETKTKLSFKSHTVNEQGSLWASNQVCWSLSSFPLPHHASSNIALMWKSTIFLTGSVLIPYFIVFKGTVYNVSSQFKNQRGIYLLNVLYLLRHANAGVYESMKSVVQVQVCFRNRINSSLFLCFSGKLVLLLSSPHPVLKMHFVGGSFISFHDSDRIHLVGSV